MVNKPKNKGTKAERWFVIYIQDNGFGGAERRSLSGAKDKGDVAGTPGLAWEVKDWGTLCLPKWLRETEAERINAKADFGILIVKPAGIGYTRVGKWWAVMRWYQWTTLCSEVATNWGYIHLRPEELSGARLGDLNNVVRRLPDPKLIPPFVLPYVLINPKGVKDPENFFVVTTVDIIVPMVRMAGYGDPYVIE